MKQLRGFRFRFYPTPAQKLELAQTFGCGRYIYNWALSLKIAQYKESQKSLDYQELSKELTQLKKDPEKLWLKQVSSVPLQQKLRHLDRAFKNFFQGKSKYPRFKKKAHRQSATYASNAFQWGDGKLTLAKMKEPLDIRWSRYFSGEPRSVTVSKDPANRYFVSFLVEEELEAYPEATESIGIDLGIKDVMVTSKGFGSGNPKYYSQYQARLKTLQKRLAKKQKGSKNREKARLKVAKLHAKIADCRKDFTHKLTTQLVRENQAIYTESLAVKNMMANHNLAKAIADCGATPRRRQAQGNAHQESGWGEALRQLQYKCNWYGRTIKAIDKWFPSSKRCNNCGYIKDKLPLDIREWTCPSCGSHHQRDIAVRPRAFARRQGTRTKRNAAKNIRAVGRTVTACGDTSNGEIMDDLLSLVKCR